VRTKIKLSETEVKSTEYFERRPLNRVYVYWLRRFGRWHVLAFEGFSACPARIFFSRVAFLQGILLRIVQ
jgi:hypothetical protein